MFTDVLNEQLVWVMIPFPWKPVTAPWTFLFIKINLTWHPPNENNTMLCASLRSCQENKEDLSFGHLWMKCNVIQGWALITHAKRKRTSPSFPQFCLYLRYDSIMVPSYVYLVQRICWETCLMINADFNSNWN